MKTNGSTGKTSKTLMLHAVFGAVQAGFGSLQIMQGFLSPEVYVVTATVITGLHSALGWYIRHMTTGPLN